MQALAFWKTVTMDRADLLEILTSLLDEHKIAFCVIGGQAANAYVEPLVSLDLDLVVSFAQLEILEPLLAQRFTVKRFPHSLDLSLADSDLRVQVQTDPRYADFIERASLRPVLGLKMPVASLEDVLRGKIWAVEDAGRRASKRQKDLADIARILEAYPELASLVPQEIRRLLID
jgi:hypothetical protein